MYVLECCVLVILVTVTAGHSFDSPDDASYGTIYRQVKITSMEARHNHDKLGLSLAFFFEQ